MESNNRIHRRSAPEDKIALFRSLFRGREDVYPRRFESRKTGKKGYSPVCANEWLEGICEKPKIKCAECHARSATEAFLFRRLETLSETVGRFRLNVELPIPFDG